jgi:hypothetical protein
LILIIGCFLGDGDDGKEDFFGEPAGFFAGDGDVALEVAADAVGLDGDVVVVALMAEVELGSALMMESGSTPTTLVAPAGAGGITIGVY